MKIGLRGGHSPLACGAVGLVDEYQQMQKYFKIVKSVFETYGHTVIDCNSEGDTQNKELSEGADKANNNNVDLFISLHMNASNGQGHGTETLVSSQNSKAYPYAQNLVNNFAELGFTNRGVKFESLYEMNHISAPNIISEICFCDSQIDIDIYNKYSWEQLAYALCNAIDSNIPKTPVINNNTPTQHNKGYIVTTYLPHSESYDGVDIELYLPYFEGVKVYVRPNSKGLWIETQYLSIDKCNELKSKLGHLFYSIEY